jgi:hypothetical protein
MVANKKLIVFLDHISVRKLFKEQGNSQENVLCACVNLALEVGILDVAFMFVQASLHHIHLDISGGW